MYRQKKLDDKHRSETETAKREEVNRKDLGTQEVMELVMDKSQIENKEAGGRNREQATENRGRGSRSTLFHGGIRPKRAQVGGGPSGAPYSSASVRKRGPHSSRYSYPPPSLSPAQEEPGELRDPAEEPWPS